ncbi:MAG: septal ring lytic transglycosylase RlpA family protein [Oscillatoriales cyanobacterium]|uniref:Probable endolytic peptidoglycan transglycosylase RlpA n=1 Tax=Microcoleus anatoxicus PTRS2 TaxID=2705321 RepID=A0ABU8YQC5_9CYAN|nr:MAG: septal ring lytic transglycosylase RlpA family protein [Oscillatoriales cyanobacterium]TAF01743.1 MAG: septal ring lytic transglycosylase RlpA family protein [Oscillatoriales cyanobacterium]TAF36186.1 MAG: septal ring lytic transglycosylase RlpA family protein [Oscillatoriales cyanobacterium]TAF61836.1 MAG: septal ring lytic transglycosylase RlpA family protein [Oscillatoriales cyanobacterium]
MKEKFVGSLLAVLLVPVLGTASSCHAQATDASRQSFQGNKQVVLAQPSPQSKVTRIEAQKVGQYQARADVDSNSIAKIQSHELEGRQAATVYLRNIPVITFLDESIHKTDAKASNASNQSKVAGDRANVSDSKKSSNSSDKETDPVWRASSLAARLNQLARNNVDPNSITVKWEKGNRYLIQANGEDLVNINAETILPDTTSDFSLDALQATNRLRRLLGNAPPLQEVIGKPQPESPVLSLGPVQVRINGWASWYGPGFDGNLSASGERFNQNDLTAAHRNLPFGTLLMVRNLDNGRTVVVRINDRGPYVGDRVIDLSAGAASVLGMMGSGVAPVEIEVIAPKPRATVGR